LTVDDVNRAIKKYLNFNNVYLAIITQDTSALKDALVANTPSPISYANPRMPKEILEEDLVYQTFQPDVRAEKVKVIPAAEFFQQAGLPVQ